MTWIASLGFLSEDSLACFKECVIDGSMLVDAEDDDLANDFAMDKRLHRVRLLREIEAVKSNPLPPLPPQKRAAPAKSSGAPPPTTPPPPASAPPPTPPPPKSSAPPTPAAKAQPDPAPAAQPAAKKSAPPPPISVTPAPAGNDAKPEGERWRVDFEGKKNVLFWFVYTCGNILSISLTLSPSIFTLSPKLNSQSD
jgi:hypothetical protein